MRKTLLTLGLSAALGFAGTANAWISFDRDGGGSVADGSVVRTDVFDWAPGNVLFENLITSSLGSTEFDLYGHGNLSAFLNNGSSVGGAMGSSEFTYTFNAHVLASEDGAAEWDLNTIGGTFEIFYDSTANSSSITGAGFADGQLILQGDFVPKLSFAGESGSVEVNPGAPGTKLDKFGADNAPGITTEIVNGNMGFEIDATYADDNFFLDDVVSSDSVFGFDLDLSSLVVAAFTQTNPSDVVGGAGGETSTFNAGSLLGSTAGANGPWNKTPNFGGDSKNDASCVTYPCDIQGQTDASSQFTAQGVPAPAPLALLGLGLLGIGARAWRKHHAA